MDIDSLSGWAKVSSIGSGINHQRHAAQVMSVIESLLGAEQVEAAGSDDDLQSPHAEPPAADGGYRQQLANIDQRQLQRHAPCLLAM
jgi:hypothetical protein